MALVFVAGAVLFGLLAGYYLSASAIIALTFIMMVLAIFLRPAKSGGLESLVGVVAWVLLCIAAVCMWGMHWYATGTLTEAWLPEISKALLRQ